MKHVKYAVIVFIFVAIGWEHTFADEARDKVIVETLERLGRFDLESVKHKTKQAALRHIDRQYGTINFPRLIEKFNIRDRNEALVEMAIEHPQDAAGIDAAALSLRLGAAPLVGEAIDSRNEDRAVRAFGVFAATQNTEAIRLITARALDLSQPMTIRTAAIRNAGRGPAGERILFELVKADRLPQDLHSIAGGIMILSRDPEIRRAAEKKLHIQLRGADKPLPPVAELATRRGDPKRGEQAYTKATCVICHKIGDTGIDFGPNLSEIGDKLPREELYQAILSPSAGISFGYEGILITLTDESQILGIAVGSESGEITLRQMGGLLTTIPAARIRNHQKLTDSLMTPGLHQLLTEQELVDLVEFLLHQRKPGG